MKNKISKKDKRDWNDFISSNEKLPDKDSLIKKTIKDIVSIDLHGYSLDEANKKVKDLIFDSYNNKVRKLKIITGKGIHSQNERDPYISKDLGILKNSIPTYIRSNNELMNMINNIQEADINDGGSGAFYIYIKKKNNLDYFNNMIIWLASYPKSGNTLVRSLLAGYFFLKTENLILNY